MSRPRMSKRVLDDAAFPIRVKLRVPPSGFGVTLIEILRWLRREIGNGNFAHHEAEALDTEALAFHFRHLKDVAAFLSTFPQLELADGTASRTYARQRSLREPPTSEGHLTDVHDPLGPTIASP